MGQQAQKNETANQTNGLDMEALIGTVEAVKQGSVARQFRVSGNQPVDQRWRESLKDQGILWGWRRR